jgi:hypothetical protein
VTLFALAEPWSWRRRTKVASAQVTRSEGGEALCSTIGSQFLVGGGRVVAHGWPRADGRQSASGLCSAVKSRLAVADVEGAEQDGSVEQIPCVLIDRLEADGLSGERVAERMDAEEGESPAAVDAP